MNLIASAATEQQSASAVRRIRKFSRGLAAACLPWLVACGSSTPVSDEDGARHGELHIYRISYPDGHSEREFYLARDEHTPATTRLVFASDPGLDPWTRVKLWAAEGPDGFKVSRDPKQWVAGKFVHPHDACFDSAGNIYVVEWVEGGRITFLKKV
jgi:hypothetical protein